jgi:hypothetical protein
MSRTPDLSVVYCGSTFLLRATSPTGQQWIVRHIPGNARWFGGVVAVEHRYIDAIIQGAIDDGLSTSGGERFCESQEIWGRVVSSPRTARLMSR